MAGKGPLPKPDGKAQGHRSRGIELAAVPTGSSAQIPVIAPRAPAGLLPATRREWREFWASPLARLVDESAHPELEELFTLRDERRRTRSSIQAAGRLLEGSQGQRVLNPLIRDLRAIDAEIRALEDRFGLNPAAALRLGVTLVEAASSLAKVNESFYANQDTDEADDVDPRLSALQQPGRNG